MTSQNPNAGHVDTYLVSMFRGDSKLTIGTKISIIFYICSNVNAQKVILQFR